MTEREVMNAAEASVSEQLMISRSFILKRTRSNHKDEIFMSTSDTWAKGVFADPRGGPMIHQKQGWEHKSREGANAQI